MDNNIFNKKLEKAYDLDVFLNILDDSTLTNDEKIKMWHTAAHEGWSEGIEVFIMRYPDITKSREGAQAWITMAGNGHTECWMQLVHEYLRNRMNEPIWNDALKMCIDDSAYYKHANIHALAYVTNALSNQENLKISDIHTEITSLYIPLLHMAPTNSILDDQVCNGLVQKAIKNIKTPFNLNEVFNFNE